MERLKTTYRMPLDVILEILVWLPAKSLLRFKCVCKEWYNLFNSHLFVKLHVNKSLKSDSQHNRILLFTRTLCIVDDLYHPVKLTKLNWPKDIITHDCNGYGSGHTVCSCNGLVCFTVIAQNNVNYENRSIKCFVICNPTTRDFKLILPSSEMIWKDLFLSYGFGYDNGNDDYKIVVSKKNWTETDRDVYVYSLKADLWSCRTPPTPVSYGRNWINRGGVIFSNKMLHYLASSDLVGDDGECCVRKSYRIVRFDIASEKWKDDLSIPAKVNYSVHLGELDGWLYLRVFHDNCCTSYINDLLIMEEYGSWKLMFHFPRRIEQLYRIIARSKEERHRLLLDEYHSLFWYDKRDNTNEHFKLEEYPRDRSGIVCIASLVPIPGCSSTKLQEITD